MYIIFLSFLCFLSSSLGLPCFFVSLSAMSHHYLLYVPLSFLSSVLLSNLFLSSPSSLSHLPGLPGLVGLTDPSRFSVFYFPHFSCLLYRLGLASLAGPIFLSLSCRIFCLISSVSSSLFYHFCHLRLFCLICLAFLVLTHLSTLFSLLLQSALFLMASLPWLLCCFLPSPSALSNHNLLYFFTLCPIFRPNFSIFSIVYIFPVFSLLIARLPWFYSVSVACVFSVFFSSFNFSALSFIQSIVFVRLCWLACLSVFPVK